MALTWRDTYKQPTADISGLVKSGELAAKGLAGFGTSLQTVADQRALADLAKFTDAQRLNEALQSGAFGGASENVLTKAMSRPDALITSAINQETLGYNQQTNPYRVNALQRSDEQGVLKQPYESNKIKQDILLQGINNPLEADKARANAEAARFTTPQIPINAQRALTSSERVYQANEASRQALLDFETLRNSNALYDSGTFNQAFQNLGNKSDDYKRAFQQAGVATFGSGAGPFTMGAPVAGGAPSVAGSGVGVSGSTTPAAGVIGGIVGADSAISPQAGKTLTAASQKYGVPTNYLVGTFGIEGGMTGKTSPTGARGPGQFVRQTWNDLAKTPEGVELGMTPITSENFQKDNDPRNNADLSIMATALLAKKNSEVLTGKGVPITPRNLYLTHNVGPEIFDALKTGKPSEKLLDSMKKNGFKEGDTVVSWADRQGAKFESFATGSDIPTPQDVAISAASTTAASNIAAAATNQSESQRLIKAFNQPAILNRQTAHTKLKEAFPNVPTDDIYSALDTITTESGTKVNGKNVTGPITQYEPIVEALMGTGGTKSGAWYKFGFGDRVETLDKNRIDNAITLLQNAKSTLVSDNENALIRQNAQANRDKINTALQSANQQLVQLQEQQATVGNVPQKAIDKVTTRRNQLLAQAAAVNDQDSAALAGRVPNQKADQLRANNSPTIGGNLPPTPPIEVGEPPAEFAERIAKKKAREIREAENAAAKFAAEQTERAAELKAASWLTPERIKILKPSEARAYRYKYGRVLTPAQRTALNKQM